MYMLILWEYGHNMTVLNVPLINPLKGERPEYSIYNVHKVYSIIVVYSKVICSDVIPEYSSRSELGLEHGQVHAYAVAAAQ